jgi:hypothetical protein
VNRCTLLVLLLVAQAARAQPLETVPPGDDQITAVKRGEPAPYAGQLYSPDTAIRWAFFLQQLKYRLVADVDRETRVCAAETGYRDELLRVERQRSATVERDLQARLLDVEQARVAAEEELRNPSWYTSPVFGAVLGVVGTSVVFGLAVYGVASAQ